MNDRLIVALEVLPKIEVNSGHRMTPIERMTAAVDSALQYADLLIVREKATRKVERPESVFPALR